MATLFSIVMVSWVFRNHPQCNFEFQFKESFKFYQPQILSVNSELGKYSDLGLFGFDASFPRKVRGTVM